VLSTHKQNSSNIKLHRAHLYVSTNKNGLTQIKNFAPCTRRRKINQIILCWILAASTWKLANSTCQSERFHTQSRQQHQPLADQQLLQAHRKKDYFFVAHFFFFKTDFISKLTPITICTADIAHLGAPKTQQKQRATN